ncbi:MAG: hypothetical protein SNG10_04860 [Rikenellaceae bacterium]
MKFTNKLLIAIVSIVAVVGITLPVEVYAVQKSVEVSSLDELLPYLKQSNVDVKMAPGVYRITAADMKAGKYPAESEVEVGRVKKPILLFEGSHNTFDFTGVTLEIEAEVFTNLDPKYREFINIQTIGNNNVIKNIKLVDIADKQDFPNRGYLNVILDGAFNRIEGVEIYSVGSSPYGYGELFGKGGPKLAPIYKHCACLVRGFKNHVLNCKIVHHGYGHCLFMQAADCPTIEGCHIESEMINTDDLLAEKGGLAEKVDYMTYFGYKIPAGYTIACSEEGIRAYNGGDTMIDGIRYKRGTSNPTVMDCYIKNVRAGVTLTHATGRKYVENCTAIGCERGFCIGSGQIVNCKADTQNGPALGVDYAHDNGMVADITILPNRKDPRPGNGSKHAAIIIGHNHKITLRRGEGLEDTPDQELLINIGGDNRTIGMLHGDNNYNANNIEIINETGYPIVLDDNTSNITGTSVGAVIDYGTDNSVVKR